MARGLTGSASASAATYRAWAKTDATDSAFPRRSALAVGVTIADTKKPRTWTGAGGHRRHWRCPPRARLSGRSRERSLPLPIERPLEQ